MGEIRDFANRLMKVSKQEIEMNLLEVLKDHEPELVDINTAQLLDGMDSEGKMIDPKYSPFTQEKKRREGKPTDKVQLLDSGEFQHGFFILAEKFPVRFTSTDEKTAKITYRYGNEIFGPTKTNLAKFNQEYLKEAIQKVFRKLCGL
jgi:hypothetical protein